MQTNLTSECCCEDRHRALLLKTLKGINQQLCRLLKSLRLTVSKTKIKQSKVEPEELRYPNMTVTYSYLIIVIDLRQLMSKLKTSSTK